MKTWNIKYEYIPDRETRHPFFRRTMQVEAEMRKEALEIAKSKVGNPNNYDRWTASPIKENEIN